jgi:sulfite reductase alpha subunit-like flavoprotein
MGKDIREAFIAMLQEKGGMSKDEASSKLHEMQSSGKFVSELWG